MLWDYIVVGGGLAGSVLSNRLLGLQPSAKIIVIEAGANANARDDVLWHNSTNLLGGDFDWRYRTVPQASADGREVGIAAGKALGGGTVINKCTYILLREV